MGVVDADLIKIDEFPDFELKKFMQKNGVSLKIDEARKIPVLIGRNPTLTELHIFNIQWSEHSSYKSSKNVLKLLPTTGPTVMQGPEEDAGILNLCEIDGEKYGIVIGHESHNHPSQVVPYEGAATGIGGIVRDVLCMGAKVIALADPLRFGSPNGKNKERTKYISNEVINGIAGYGNPIGVPNIAGDIYFNESFDDNCIVNVVCLGLIKEKDIIHSHAPKNAVGYDIIVVGKATDNSGFGGAAFASLVLNEEDKESNRGAVQVPDPFLKNVIIRATYEVFEEARKNNVILGFKDMGAGGIMCSTVEQCLKYDYGAEIDLCKIHTSMELPPYIIACSETQERFAWISPPEFTKKILEIYNEKFELPNISEGARASIVGKITEDGNYTLKKDGNIVCNAPAKIITEGIRYDRERKKPVRDFKEPRLEEPKSYKEAILKILKHPNVASKAKCYKHYDTLVQGKHIITSGNADAGVIAPIFGNKVGVALTVDNNPKYCRIDPYNGSINAVAEAMRNLAAVGATPIGMTDCLNFGNPEDPESFDDFYNSVKGISDAAKNLYLKGTKFPVPFVSGNVSFYNFSSTGKSVDPSAIIACVGKIDDYSKAITMKLKGNNSNLFLIGARKDELGGSVHYGLNNEIGKNIPLIDFENERNMIYFIIDCINKGLVLSCHDISDGGLITSISEMILGGEADGKIGAEINLDFSEMMTDKLLFSESSGFVFEIDDTNNNIENMKNISKKYNIDLIPLGKTIENSALIINKNNKKIIELKVDEMKKAWTSGFIEALE